MFKNPTIDFNGLSNPLGNSTCSPPEVVLAFFLYEDSTIHNSSDQFVSCVYFFFVDFAFHPPAQKKNSDLYAPSSNSWIFTPIENWTWTYLLGIVHTTTSKIFTISPETPCMCYVVQIRHCMNSNVINCLKLIEIFHHKIFSYFGRRVIYKSPPKQFLKP